MESHPHPDTGPVASMTYKGTGQTIALHRGSIVVLGRGILLGILSAHVSRKQVEVIVTDSPTFEISAVRRGTNRSLLNRKELPKDVPTIVHDGDILTLLEAEYPISFEINRPDTVLSATKISQKNSISDSQISPKGVSLSTTSIAPQGQFVSQKTTPTTATSTAETTALSDVVKNEQDDSILQRVKESIAAEADMDLDERMSETTSESEVEDRHVATERPESDEEEEGYLSNESSLICDDLSDLESSHPQHHTPHPQHSHQGPRDSIVLD